MAIRPNIIRNIAEGLGDKLHNACRQNNVAHVELLTSKMTMDEQRDWISTTDRILVLVLYHESIEPAYRFLVDSNLANPEQCIDRNCQVLGAEAGLRKYRQYSMVESLLEKGIDPDHYVDMYCGKLAIATAAGFSDQRMVGLLLDHGATLNGSAALICAAEQGNEENVRYLLARGADANEMVPAAKSRPEREELSCALHKAVESGHSAVVEISLEAGADVKLKDAKCTTVGEITVTKGIDGTILAKLAC